MGFCWVYGGFSSNWQGVIWLVFELCPAQFELKGDNSSRWRSSRGSSTAYEEACSSWVIWTSTRAVQAWVGVDRTSQAILVARWSCRRRMVRQRGNFASEIARRQFEPKWVLMRFRRRSSLVLGRRGMVGVWASSRAFRRSEGSSEQPGSTMHSEKGGFVGLKREEG